MHSLLVSVPLVAGLFAGLLAQWALAVFALSRLFLLRPKKWVSIVMNLAVVLIVIVGPSAFLIWYYASGKDRMVKERFAKLAAEKKAQISAGETGEAEREGESEESGEMPGSDPARPDKKSSPEEGTGK